ncbi:hypothetical protein MASR2M117_16650 [Paludibacter sp.]
MSNKEKDFFVCPMGQHMEKAGEAKRKSESGFISKVSYYEAKNCTNCPLRSLCFKAEGNRRIEVNHNLNRHKEIVRKLLTSEEGLYHRSRRPIEPEAVFGQSKSNKQYFRFRHFGKNLIAMDFAIFAIAFNIGKLHKIMENTHHRRGKSDVFSLFFVLIIYFCSENKKLLKLNSLSIQNQKLVA